MKVILTTTIKKLGKVGDLVNVKDGYARNYLISNKKALYASKENIKEVEKIKVELNKKDLEKKKTAKNIADKLATKQYEFKRLVTENNELYGSIKPTEISKMIFEKAQGEGKLELVTSALTPLQHLGSIHESFVTRKINRQTHSASLKFFYDET